MKRLTNKQKQMVFRMAHEITLEYMKHSAPTDQSDFLTKYNKSMEEVLTRLHKSYDDYIPEEVTDQLSLTQYYMGGEAEHYLFRTNRTFSEMLTVSEPEMKTIGGIDYFQSIGSSYGSSEYLITWKPVDGWRSKEATDQLDWYKPVSIMEIKLDA